MPLEKNMNFFVGGSGLNIN